MVRRWSTSRRENPLGLGERFPNRSAGGDAPGGRRYHPGVRGFQLAPAGEFPRDAAVAAALAAAVLLVFLQELGQRLRHEEHRAWWASNGRDVLNLAGIAAMAGSLRLYGFPGPAALLAGGLFTLLTYGSYVLAVDVARVRRPRLLAVGTGWAVVGLLLLFPEPVLAFLGQVAGALFPGFAAGANGFSAR